MKNGQLLTVNNMVCKITKTDGGLPCRSCSLLKEAFDCYDAVCGKFKIPIYSCLKIIKRL